MCVCDLSRRNHQVLHDMERSPCGMRNVDTHLKCVRFSVGLTTRNRTLAQTQTHTQSIGMCVASFQFVNYCTICANCSCSHLGQMKYFGIRSYLFAIVLLRLEAITFRANGIFAMIPRARKIQSEWISITQITQTYSHAQRHFCVVHIGRKISIKSFSRKWIQITFMKIAIRSFVPHVSSIDFLTCSSSARRLLVQQPATVTVSGEKSDSHQPKKRFRGRKCENCQIKFVYCYVVAFWIDSETLKCAVNHAVCWQIIKYIEIKGFFWYVVRLNKASHSTEGLVEWARCVCRAVIAWMIRSTNLPRAGQQINF